MTHEFRLADIGEGLEEAEIIEWRVQIGDHVRRDQPIVEVMTDKSNAELPAPVDGVVVALGGNVGDMVEVGSVLAVIDPILEASTPAASTASSPPSPIQEAQVEADSLEETQSEDSSTAAEAVPEPDDGFETPVITPPVSTFQVAAATTPVVNEEYRRPQRPKASPTTRVEAARRGIDLNAVEGTGPGGRILLTDLDRFDAADHAADAGSKTDLPPIEPPAAEPASPAESSSGPGALPSAAVTAPAEPPSPTSAAAATTDTPASAAAESAAAQSQPAQSQPAQSQPAQSQPAQSQATRSATAGQETAASERAADLADGAATEPLRGIRRAIARNMDRSWNTIPHIHSFQHIDAEPLLELRDQLRSSGRPEFESLTPLSFFVAAVANAIEQHPIANASLDLEAETITHHQAINIGVAVAAPQGLVVPVISDVGNQSLAAIAGAVRGAVDGARAGSLPAEAFRDGTATITNFGSLGGEQALPLIRPPESVIFGFGSIAPRPFVIDDEVVARKTMHLVVATDHRLLDGDVTTALLSRVGFLLENPINLVLGD